MQSIVLKRCFSFAILVHFWVGGWECFFVLIYLKASLLQGEGGGGEILFAMISGYQCESTKIGFDIKSAEIGFNIRPTLSRDLVCTQWAADRRPGWTGAGSV